MALIAAEDMLYPFMDTEAKRIIEGFFIGVTALEASSYLLPEKGVSVHFADGFDASSFRTDANICVVGQVLLSQLGKAFGDEIEIRVLSKAGVFSEREPETVTLRLTVAGSFSGDDINCIYAPFAVVTEAVFASDGSPVSTESLSATVSDNAKITELKDAAQEYYAVGDTEGAQISYTLTVYDDTYNRTVTAGERNIRTHRMLLAAVLALSGLIGFAACWVLTRRRRQEFAVMRSLGTKKRTVFAAVIWEQLVLCIAGAGFANIAYLFVMKDWVNPVLILICIASFVLGASVALRFILSFQVMKIMRIKE